MTPSQNDPIPNTINDHLGNSIIMGSTVFWPVTSGSAIYYNYGVLQQVKRNTRGQLYATVQVRDRWSQGKTRTATVHRLDLLTVISPDQMPN